MATNAPLQFDQVQLCFLYLVSCKGTSVLHAKIAVLLVKVVIEPVPPTEMKKGLYSPYFIIPNKGGGLHPILDLWLLNRALHKLLFKMLTQKHILTCIRQQDCFTAIDLKDVYFHVLILPFSVHFWGSCIPVQGPTLSYFWPIPVTSHLYESSFDAELPEDIEGKNSSSTEKVLEALGAYDILGGSYTIWDDHIWDETTIAFLQSQVLAQQHTHNDLSSLIQTLHF